MKNNKKGLGKFVLGAAVGAGLGILFAPKKGSETRADLKNKMDDLIAKVKDIDAEDVKHEVEYRVTQIKNELADLDKEKALDIAKEKGEKILKKIEKLAKDAKKKAEPVVESAVEELRVSAVKVTKNVLEKLEKPEEKKTSKK